MKKTSQEIIVGLFMILGIIALVFLALKVSGLTNYRSTGSYLVTAEFDNIGGLKVQSPVTLAGVRIGEVENITLDQGNFRAKVTLAINEDQNHLPNDSMASIYTQGLLGANYISITPGYAETYLKGGDTISNTSSALVLEKLIGQFIYNMKNSNSNK